jgi:hypothetical protein
MREAILAQHAALASSEPYGVHHDIERTAYVALRGVFCEDPTPVASL